MNLFRISRELQLSICHHGESCLSPHTAREGELFYRGEKEVVGVEGILVNGDHGFSLAGSLPGKNRCLSSCWTLGIFARQGMRAPVFLVFQPYLIEVSVLL